MNRLASLLSILGLSAAVYLSRLYYSMQAGTAGFKSFCNLSGNFNCDLVTTTKYAQILPGLPLSSLVAGWFLALFFISIAAHIAPQGSDWKKDTVRIGFVMSLFGSVYSVLLLLVMIFVIKTFCLFCLAIDVANWALLVVFWKQIPSPVLKNLKTSKSMSYIGFVFGCLFITTLLIRSSSQPVENSLSSSDQEYIVNQIYAQAPIEKPLPEGVSYLGAKDARVTILELSDFQCPFCQKGAFLTNSLLSLYPTQLRVGFMHFPLDSSCHRQITRPMHPFACQLARGSVCADKKGKFKEYYESIFENQSSLTADSAKNTLLSVGLAEEEAKLCLESDEAKRVITSQIEYGIENKVESTPTFFINGKKVDGAYPLDVWKMLIDRELAGK
jgi:protein-disulfide isomerase